MSVQSGKFPVTFWKMNRKSTSAGAFGSLLADYSKQNDTVFKLSKENKHWKTKYTEELALKNEAELLNKNEVANLHAQIEAIQLKTAKDSTAERENFAEQLTKARCSEFERIVENSQADEEHRKEVQNLKQALKDMRFEHELEKIRLEEKYRKEAAEIRKACEELENESKEEKAALETRMLELIDQERSKSRRLTSRVARLKDEIAVARMIDEMADTTYFDNKLKEKDDEYARLKQKSQALGLEKDRLLKQAEEREELLVQEFKARETEILRVADERRRCFLKEKKEIVEREKRMVREAQSRVEQVKKEGEQKIAELKQKSDQAQTVIKKGFEEQIHKLKSEHGKQGMRLLKAGKQREDQLRADLAKEVESRKVTEANAQMKHEQNQKLLQENSRLSDHLATERRERAEHLAEAYKQKEELDHLIEQRVVEFQNYKNSIETERFRRDSEWDAEKQRIAKRYEITVTAIAAEYARLKARLEEVKARQGKEAIVRCLAQTRSSCVIEGLNAKLRGQRNSYSELRRQRDDAWKLEKEGLLEKYRSVKQELSDRQVIHDARLKRDNERWAEKMTKATEESDQLMEVIGAYRRALADLKQTHADELNLSKAQQEEDRVKGIKERNKLTGEIKDLRMKVKQQVTCNAKQRRRMEKERMDERLEWYERCERMKADMVKMQVTCDKKIRREERITWRKTNERLQSRIASTKSICEERLRSEIEREHLQELRQLDGSYEARLKDERWRYKELAEDFINMKRNYDSFQFLESERCGRLFVGLHRRLDWQRIGTEYWVSSMKRHHKVDMDDLSCKLETCKGELSDANAHIRELQGKLEVQEDHKKLITQNHFVEMELIKHQVETAKGEQGLAKVKTSYLEEKARRLKSGLKASESIHHDSLNKVIRKSVELIRDIEEEEEDLKSQVASKVAELEKRDEMVRQRQSVLDARERDMMQLEHALDAREEELNRRNITLTNQGVDLSKQAIDLKNLREKLRQEDSNLARLKDELSTDGKVLKERAAAVQREKERLEEYEIDVAQREKEARHCLVSSKVPDRLPIDQSFSDLEDTKEQLKALEKQLAEQEWYFLARESEFQNAKVENKSYKIREEKIKLLEVQLQKKECELEEMEVEMKINEATMEAALVEMETVRHTLGNGQSLKGRRNRGVQACEEQIIREVGTEQSTQCGADDQDEPELPTPDHTKVTIIYKLEEADSATEVYYHTQPAGLQACHPSVLNQVYPGHQAQYVQARVMPPHGQRGPHPALFRLPPPGKLPMMRPPPHGRHPHPRPVGPFPRPPPPFRPGFARPPHPHGPGFYRPPHGPFGREHPLAHGPRRQLMPREDRR